MSTIYKTSPSEDYMSRLFLPPINRSMRTLDCSFFQKTIPLSAARIFDPKDIAIVRKQCSADILCIRRVDSMVEDPDQTRFPGRKVMLLKPHLKHDDLTAASEKLQEFIRKKALEIIPWELHMKYEHWNFDEIMTSILPEELHADIPSSYAQSGHVAHLNLRPAHLPYKHIIAAVILDKNTSIKTVVNKVDDVGASSVFRTFPMEVLAGPPDTLVTVKESNCTFTFDFAKVYWNTRLGHEHERITEKFSAGEAVCDVMAGVGPFALPAAKKGCVVYANDLNPDSYVSLKENIARNKLVALVKPYNLDGRVFVKQAIRELYAASQDFKQNPFPIPSPSNARRSPTKRQRPKQTVKAIPPPPTFHHFVMNLPASAIEFLGAYVGAYAGLEHIFEGREMPWVHVYTFYRETVETTKEDAGRDICKEISNYMDYDATRLEIELHDVRRVAPRKVMYCVSFRLPKEVAFRRGVIE